MRYMLFSTLNDGSLCTLNGAIFTYSKSECHFILCRFISLIVPHPNKENEAGIAFQTTMAVLHKIGTLHQCCWYLSHGSNECVYST